MIERIFMLHHTHVDLGYTGDRSTVCDELVAMVDRVTDLVEASRSRPSPEQFRWVHEVSWPVLEYLRRGGLRRDKLFEHIRAGLVELSAIYVNPTDLFDRRSLEWSIDQTVDLARMHDLPLTTGMFSDCPGVVWTLPDILNARGIRYVSASPNFTMSMPLEVERPFYWVGPEGGRVLTWFTDWRTWWYGDGRVAFKFHKDAGEATRKLIEYVALLEGEGYRWKGLAVHFAMDNEWPRPELSDFIAHFNASQEGRKIELTMATNRDFFTFMESRHGSEFQTHRGAWPDWWANGHSSAAFETAASRRTKASLLRSEALARHLGKERDPDVVRKAMENMVMFDEHTWGHSASVGQPWAAVPRLQWDEKRALGIRGMVLAQRAEENLVKGMRGAEDDVLLINPFEADFRGVACIPTSGKKKGKEKSPQRLQCESTGEALSGQRVAAPFSGWPEDCYVVHVPARSVSRMKVLKSLSERPRAATAMENDFFRIAFDSGTGSVVQIHDKKAGLGLCDEKAEWSFAELIHERIRGGDRDKMYDAVSYSFTDPRGKMPRPDFMRQGAHRRKHRVRLVSGPVFACLTTSGRLPGVRYTREVRMYHALPRIDVFLRIEKDVVTTYESLYLAFPFAGSNPEVWIENAGAVYRAGIDQLPGSATDWLNVGDYVAVSGAGHTVVLVPHDAPLVQVGDTNTGKWAPKLEVRNGQVFSWLMNNMWFTNFPAFQEGVVHLTWSLTSHAGAFQAGLASGFAANARVGIVTA